MASSSNAPQRGPTPAAERGAACALPVWPPGAACLAAAADLSRCPARADSVLPQVVALFERVVNEEGTNNVNVEDVAAKAMAAVEGAVKDEVEAAAVVEATQNALEATLKELQVGSRNSCALCRQLAPSSARTAWTASPSLLPSARSQPP